MSARKKNFITENMDPILTITLRKTKDGKGYILELLDFKALVQGNKKSLIRAHLPYDTQAFQKCGASILPSSVLENYVKFDISNLSL